MFTHFAARLFGRHGLAVLLRLIRETAWQHRGAYALAMGLMALAAVSGAGVALVMDNVMQDVFIERRAEMVPVIAAWVLGLFLLRGAAAYGQTVILGRIGNRIVARLQARIHDHLLAEGPTLGASERSGAMTARITHSRTAARQAPTLVATRLGTDLLSVAALVAVMLWQDLALSLLALVGMPAALAGVAALLRRVQRHAQSEVTLQAEILGALGETLQGIRVIKAFGLDRAMRERFGAAVDSARRRADGIVRLRGLISPLMEAAAGVAAAAVILYGGWRVIAGSMEVGAFFSFVTAVFLCADPARRLAQLNLQIRQNLAGIAFIYALLDAPADVTEPAAASELAVTRGEVRFDKVDFAYAGVPALNGLDLVARPGEVTALVGPSGAGKSTVFALLERFFDPDAGRITIDGQDIRTVGLDSLRRQIALVTQETFLFDASVAENIAYGRAGATRAEVEAAAQAANAHDFIAALAQGYDSPVGEGGMRLSGGERQRIAIARAMLRDAPILLLDEATSALDAEAETRVQEALERLMAGRTTIVIAHRLATVRRAQQICVIEAGRVVERGTHASLAGAGGLYARLAALQFGPGGGRQ